MAVAELKSEGQSIAVRPGEKMPGWAVLAVACGLLAAWAAAGSMGAVTPPLQRAIAWLGMAVVVIAGWPRSIGFRPVLLRNIAFYIVPAIFVATAMTVSAEGGIRALAVAVLLAGFATIHVGQAGRALMLGALAVTAFGLYRLAIDSTPAAWLLAAAIGRCLGWLAGAVTGQPLWTGESFAGLDFLVAMSVIYGGWLLWSAPPRRGRAIGGAVAILGVYATYMILLSFSGAMRAALPEPAAPTFTEISRLGTWTWNAALRSLLPWNVPVVAAVLNAVVAAVMLRHADFASCGAAVSAASLAGGTPAPQDLSQAPGRSSRGRRGRQAQRQLKAGETKGTVPFSWNEDWDGPLTLRQLVPLVLAIAFPLAAFLVAVRPSLGERTVLAYDPKDMDWSKPEGNRIVPANSSAYGLLPELVVALGGQFERSAELSEDDLGGADVLVLLPNRARGSGTSDKPAYCSDEQLANIWNFVRRGGTLLVGAGPETLPGAAENLFNQMLGPTAMRINDTAAVSLTEQWEQNLLLLPHPGLTGLDPARGQLGFGRAASIRCRWPARPLAVGRWGWSEPGGDAVADYTPGDELGDLVLAAEQAVGNGRVIVLGDATCFSNDALPVSYPFAARLLGYLATEGAGNYAALHQLLAIAATVGLAGMLLWRPDPVRLAVTLALLAAVVTGATLASRAIGEVLPTGGRQSPPPIAYIDGSHLNAFSSDLASEDGLREFSRTLARNGFLPLVAPDLRPERLERAAMLCSIAPSQAFSAEERTAVLQFVQGGGLFVHMVGAMEVEPSRQLLDDFGFGIVPAVITPNRLTAENEPLGAATIGFTEGKKERQARLYAGWPVETYPVAGQGEAQVLIEYTAQNGKYPVIVYRRVGQGIAALIGDSGFALNKNMEPESGQINDNVRFWHWLLEQWGQKTPPPPSETALPAEAGLIETAKPKQ